MGAPNSATGAEIVLTLDTGRAGGEVHAGSAMKSTTEDRRVAPRAECLYATRPPARNGNRLRRGCGSPGWEPTGRSGCAAPVALVPHVRRSVWTTPAVSSGA